MAMAIDCRTMTAIKNLLLSESIWESLNLSVKVLKPIVQSLNELQANNCVIYKVFKSFAKLELILYTEIKEFEIFEEDEESILKYKIEERKKFAVKPIHIAATKLDPTSLGCELTPVQSMDASEFIHNTAENMVLNEDQDMADFAAYQHREGVWRRVFILKAAGNRNPFLWWKMYAPQTDLTRVAVQILSSPTTSAAMERSFSTFDWMHNKKRNRPTIERAGKLTYLSYNHNLCTEMWDADVDLSDNDFTDFSDSSQNL